MATGMARNVATTSTTTGADSILFKIKLFFMVFLVVLDMGLNSSVEHETFGTWNGESRDGTVLALVLGFQLVVQVGTFGSLFLMMFETYPFRVGLMGMLTSQYLTVYVINVLYFITTACVYGYRVTTMVQSEESIGIWQVWDLRGYLFLSIVHKIAATVYYVTNIRAALLLGDPMFYSKQAWVGMYFDQGGGLGWAGPKGQSQGEREARLQGGPESSDTRLHGAIDGLSGNGSGV